MIPRAMHSVLLERARTFPVVTLTGPRQAGKTTLCRAAFPAHTYVSLEAPDVRERAARDPRGLLGDGGRGFVIDEVQRVPELVSYLQTLVDDEPRATGRFILTGSYNLAVHQAVAQSLAGRTALLELMPLSIAELRAVDLAPASPWQAIFAGGYPAIFDRGVDASVWIESYVGTYLERDVRSVLAVGDLLAFQTFLGLCAGRTSNLVNLSQLGADAGVTHNTARAWLSVLEAGFVVQRLPARHGSPTTRLVKTPKLHFHDTGVACWLLGLRNAAEVASHPLRGALFESWVVAEIGKAIHNAGTRPRMSFFRDRKGVEVDIVVEHGSEILAIETKSGATYHPEHAAALHAFERLVARGPTAKPVRKIVVYAGADAFEDRGVTVLPWDRVDAFDWPG